MSVQPIMSDGVGLSFTRESTPGTQPTTGVRKLQANPGGIKKFKRENVVVTREPLSPNLTTENGEVVGYDVSPEVDLDVTKDFWDLFRELTFRSTTKQNGSTGTAQFFPTAVVAGSPAQFTVAAGGGLAAGHLVNARNFTNAANNGIHLVAGTSATTHVDTADTLVTETPPANAVLEVIGVQGATTDLALDASGNLTSGGGAGAHIDFTTLNLQVGQRITIGDVTSGAAFAFANYAGPLYADIVTIAAAKLTLKWRSWTPAGADAGTGKTIRILFHTANTNVIEDPTGANGYLQEPTASFELAKPGSGGASTDYTYFNGCAVGGIKIDGPLEGKLTATLSLIGMKAGVPTASQGTGFSAALNPVGFGPHTTSAKLVDIRLMNQATEAVLPIEINTWSLDYKNNVKALKAQGTAGAIGHIFGKYQPMLSIKAYVTDSSVNNALNSYTSLSLVMMFKASDGTGFSLTFPMCKLSKGDETFAANDGETIDIDVTANRDPATGILWTLSQFGYLP